MNSKDIKQLLAGEDHNASLSELKNGRNCPEPDVDTFKKELNPKKHDIYDQHKRPDKRVKVDAEDNGGEGGNSGDGKTRPEPVARIAIALQKLIRDRAVAFTFGNPVGLNADPEEGTKEEDVYKAVKRVLFDTKSRTINRRVARAIFSCTEAAELWYPVEKENDNYGFASKHKLRVAIFSPIFGDRLYPYFDETGDMVAFSREFSRKDKDGESTAFFETYTDEYHYLWRTDNKEWGLVEGFPKKNIIGKIPVIYGRQPQVEWADVQALIERLETLLSNFADTNDYHASPKIVVRGTVLGFAKKGENGAIIELDGDNADAKYLEWAHAPESVRLEIETLLRLIYTITQTPDISFDAVKGIGAVSGIALKLLFLDAHLKVQDKMEVFDDYLQRRLSVIQAYLSVMNTKEKDFSAACKSLTIEPEIVPFMIEDEAAKVELLMRANGNKPIASQKQTVQQLNWVEDSEAEYEQIQEETLAGSYTDLINPHR